MHIHTIQCGSGCVGKTGQRMDHHQVLGREGILVLPGAENGLLKVDLSPSQERDYPGGITGGDGKVYEKTLIGKEPAAFRGASVLDIHVDVPDPVYIGTPSWHSF